MTVLATVGTRTIGTHHPVNSLKSYDVNAQTINQKGRIGLLWGRQLLQTFSFHHNREWGGVYFASKIFSSVTSSSEKHKRFTAGSSKQTLHVIVATGNLNILIRGQATLW